MSTEAVAVAPEGESAQDEERRHLIYSYFMESTGIVDVFRILFESFLKTDEILKLNRAEAEDGDIIVKLKETMNQLFRRPESTIAPEPQKLRLNAYWRLFGYTIKGKEEFPKAAGYYAEFNKTFEDAMIQIFHGILDKGVDGIKLGNPAALAEILNNMRKQLLNRTYNTIQDIAEESALLMSTLVQLLENDHLMATRLNVRATGWDSRLLELGEKLKARVAKAPSYLLLLANRMETFLRDVEDTEWTPENAAALFDDEKTFKEISTAWYQVTGKDFQAEAVRARQKPR